MTEVRDIVKVAREGAGTMGRETICLLVHNESSPNLTAVNNKCFTPQFLPVENLGAA